MNQVPVVRTPDRRMGIIGAIVFLLLAFFILFFFTFSEPDPPKITIPVPIILAEQGITDFEISNAGGGAPSENTNPVPAPEENPQEQATQEESAVKVFSGTGKTKNANTTPTETSAPNPFSGKGSGGSGTKGSGGGFGEDTGPGAEKGDPGKGSEGERVRLANIHSKPKTPNDERSKIAFKLTVDATGRVLKAEVLREGTTASNQNLIDEVIGLVMKEVKYKSKPGSRNEFVYYTVTVQPG